MSTLDCDVVRLVADCSLQTTFKVALVCRDWRDSVDDGHCVHFVAWRALTQLRDTSLMRDLVTALRLSPAKLKKGNYTRKRRWGGGCYNIFERDVAIHLFRKNGGFGGLETRLVRYNKVRKSREEL